MKRVLVLVLVLSAGVLAWVIRWQLAASGPTPTVDTASAPSALASLEREGPGEIPSLPPLRSLSDTVERPLFRSDRRPAPAGEVAQRATGTSAKPPNRILTGVVIVGGEPEALLRGDDPAVAERARVGDRIDGWEVVSIEPQALVLTRGDDTHTLRLWDRFDEPPPSPLSRRRNRSRATEEAEANEDPDDVDPAAIQRPRRPLQGPRRAARERIERRRAQREALN